MGVWFGLLLCAAWFYVVYSGLRHAARKIGSLFGFRSAESRATWTNDDYRYFANEAARPESAPPSIDDITDDMEEALASEEQIADGLRKELSVSRQALAKLEKVAGDWADRAALALSKDRNDLARAAIVERLRTQDLITDLKAKMADSRALLDGYESDIVKLHEKLSDTYRRQHHAYARIERAEQAERTQRLLSRDQSDMFNAELNRLERTADDIEGRSEAIGLGDATSPGPFAALEQEHRIDRELARLGEVVRERAQDGDRKAG